MGVGVGVVVPLSELLRPCLARIGTSGNIRHLSTPPHRRWSAITTTSSASASASASASVIATDTPRGHPG